MYASLFVATVITYFTFCRLWTYCFLMAGQPQRTWASSSLRFRDNKHSTLSRTPLDEGSARGRDYLTKLHSHKRQTSMPLAGFKPEIPASEQPHTHALDRAATGIGVCVCGRYSSHFFVVCTTEVISRHQFYIRITQTV